MGKNSNEIPAAAETRLIKRIRELDNLLIELNKEPNLVTVPEVVDLVSGHNQVACNNDIGSGYNDAANADDAEDGDNDGEGSEEESSNECNSLTGSEEDKMEDEHSFNDSSDEAVNTESIKLDIAGLGEPGTKKKNRLRRKSSLKLCSSSVL